MKKVIEGKLYNTETAELICEWSNGYFCSDFEHCWENLYKTKKGNWFLYGEGGAMSKYAKSSGDGRRGGSDITCLTKEEAIEWLEQKEFPNTLMEHFPEAVEEA